MFLAHLSIFVITASVATGQILQCFVCMDDISANSSSNCKGPNVANMHLRDCTNGTCVQIITTTGLGSVQAQRSCERANFSTTACSDATIGKKCTTCRSNGCNNGNGSGNNKTNVMFLIVTAFIGLIANQV